MTSRIPWVRGLALLAGALVLTLCERPAKAREPYPTGSVTRIYAGEVSGQMLGLVQRGTVEAEVTEIATTGTTSTYRVRGKFREAPLLAGGLAGEWSNYIDAIATGLPFRADAAWADGSGRVFAEPSSDWTSIRVAASGTVVGIAVTLDESTVRLQEQRTNAAPALPPEAPAPATTNGDTITLTDWTGLGTHAGQDLRRMAVTRQLYSASNEKKIVRLSFEPLNWSIGGDVKKIDGRVFILWQTGPTSFRGGHFDWHGVGQQAKTQENIFGGYLGGEQPPAGAAVWYCISNREGTERTNIAPGGNW